MFIASVWLSRAPAAVPQTRAVSCGSIEERLAAARSIRGPLPLIGDVAVRCQSCAGGPQPRRRKADFEVVADALGAQHRQRPSVAAAERKGISKVHFLSRVPVLGGAAARAPVVPSRAGGAGAGPGIGISAVGTGGARRATEG